MKNRNDGGPAFPFPDEASNMYGDRVPDPWRGMSLRDWFAGQVSGHIWKYYQEDGTSIAHHDWREGVAVESVRMADELIAALEK